jgi:hypothetical protein
MRYCYFAISVPVISGVTAVVFGVPAVYGVPANAGVPVVVTAPAVFSDPSVGDNDITTQRSFVLFANQNCIR